MFFASDRERFGELLTDLSALIVGTGTRKRTGNSIVKFYLHTTPLATK
jgi:hypothetical protein